MCRDRERVTDRRTRQDEAGDATTGSGRDSRKCSATPAEHRKRANGERQAEMAGSNIASGGSSFSLSRTRGGGVPTASDTTQSAVQRDYLSIYLSSRLLSPLRRPILAPPLTVEGCFE